MLPDGRIFSQTTQMMPNNGHCEKNCTFEKMAENRPVFLKLF
jgi:hypothetical protein